MAAGLRLAWRMAKKGKWARGDFGESTGIQEGRGRKRPPGRSYWEGLLGNYVSIFIRKI